MFNKRAAAVIVGAIFMKITFMGTGTSQGVPVIAADMGGQSVFSFSAPEVITLAVGNEANGLSAEVRRAAAYTVKIPMRGTQESLNAGVAAAICMYALRRDKFL